MKDEEPKDLRARLLWAMAQQKPPVKQIDLVNACKSAKEKISSAAVAKWFTSPVPPKFLKPQYLFPIARILHVDAEWLATGKGAAKPGQRSSEFEPRHVALLQAYLRLPEETRFLLRGLIETLNGIQSASYMKYSQGQEDHNKKRDKIHDREKSPQT